MLEMNVIGKLEHWREKLPLLPSPRERPNDFQRLVLTTLANDMTVSDAHRVFGVAEITIRDWRRNYTHVTSDSDKIYFMRRARELGAGDEVIAHWFGYDRVDQVAMLLAEQS